jgi:hypothetical protein
MEIVDLVRRDRRSLEHRESRVGEDALVRWARRPVLARHAATVGGGIAASEAVPFIVGANAGEAVAARQFSLEVIDTRQFDIRHGALVMIAVLVEPRNRVRTRAAVRWRMVLRDGRSASLRRGLRVQQPFRQRSRNDGSDAKLQQTAPV